jgi:hypothetical protein
VNDHFYVCSNELLKSLNDGLDLRTAAAEYILAFENLHTLPTEPLFKSLKATAELVLKAEEEEKTEFEQDYHLPEGMGYLFALQHTHGEPTNHVWKNGLQAPIGGRVMNPFTGDMQSVDTRHAVWPYYQPTDGRHPYQRHHFPFHEVNHPLLRTNAVTGQPAYVEVLRNWALSGHSQKEKDMEKAFFETLGKKHPIVGGYQKGNGGKKIKIIGDTQPNGTLLHHQHDLYDRDYFRWLKQNLHRQDELIAEGMSNADMKKQLRREHFEERAKEWESVDGEGHLFGENTMGFHATRLGHLGYMLGLEWFSPEERTAVMNHIDENGLDDHELIKLPNGEKFPAARLTYNALMRMTPEMNWAIRPMTMMGRNAHYRQEDNETDYNKGEEGMFLQQALGRLSHEPLDEFDGNSIASYIHEAIKDAYGSHRRMKYLPRLNIHKEPMKSLPYDELFDASRLHFKGKQRGLEKVRMTKDDLLYLAGYDPKTRELMEDHPLYGALEEPIVNADMIDYIEAAAKQQSSLHRQIKDIRNHRAFFTSPYGPHPDEDKPAYWQEHESGFTYGPGHFWSSPFQSTGGAGTNLATYHEVLNATHADEDGVSPFSELTENRDNYIQPSEKNRTLAHYFMPLRLQGIGETTKEGKYLKFKYNQTAEHIQNLLSAFGVSPKKGGREGATNKNNHTEHKSSLNPQYEYNIRGLTENEMKNKFTGSFLRGMAFPHTVNPTLHVGGYTAYGASPSDSRSHANAILAHNMETLGGRMFHPHTPAKKSFSSAKDWKRGDESASGGMTREEFIDFMRWSGQSGFSFDSMKNKVIDNPSLNHTVMAVTNASKILGTQNPKDILDYLHNEENHDKLNEVLLDKNLGEFDKTKLNNGLNGMIGSLDAEIKEKKKNQKTKTVMAANEEDAVSRILQFGNMYPASQKEDELLEQVDSLNERLMEEQIAGTPPEELIPMREQLQQATQQLEQLQAQATVKKPTTHWEKDQNRLEQVTKGHRQTIAQVARDIILPKYLEHDPNAFDPNDPATFLANHHQLMRDAQRYIASVPHSVHGLTTTNYGSDLSVKETSKGVQNPFHKTMAQHLSKDGKVIDGTMSVDEVLSVLGVEKNGVTKEKARELIELSSERNTPLYASTVKDVLLSGKIPNIDAINLNHFSSKEIMSKPEEELTDEERFYRHVRENGYHEAIDHYQKQANGQSDWKSHPSHAIPRYMNMMLNPSQFEMSMLSAGIGAVSGDFYNAKGTGSKTLARTSNGTKNNLDTIVHFDPRVMDDEEGIFTPGEDISETAGIGQRPVGAPSPVNTAITDNFDSGAWHHGFELTPTLGAEFDSEGNIHVGGNVGPGLYHSVPEELTQFVHGKDVSDAVYANAPPPQNPNNPHQSMNMETGEIASESMNTIATSEMTELITSLLDPDVLLSKSDDAKWSPAVRPMHRIFDLADLEHLRGFSGSWVVSKWYDGKRVIIVRNDGEITAYDENGRKKGLRKATKEALDKMNDKNYTLDGILGEEELNIIDIINYDDTNVGEMQLFERLKILRSQFDSQEHVIVPGPHDTRMTDDAGLEDAVKNLKEDHENILLRDNKSTYMRGERRHPKWIVYRDSRDFNFIVLDRRGSGPYTYQLGAGPILDIEGLGNRAIEYKGLHYMDVGTAHNQNKVFKVGDIVRASITGISKKNRKNRPVYNVQVKELEGEGEGEGAASTESLDLMTKAFAPILVPHDIQIHDEEIQIVLNDVDTVVYKMEEVGDAWVVHSPKSTMGDLTKTDYPVVLAESLMPFWSSVAPLMVKGLVTKKVEVDMPKKPTEEEMEEGSAGIIDDDDENRLLKPNQTKKALEVIMRALDKISKERMTWTGPKGLGIDVGTPQESPRGPTQLRDESTLPDFDGEKKNTDEKKEKKKERLNHIEVQTDEGENLSIEYDGDQPLVSRN